MSIAATASTLEDQSLDSAQDAENMPTGGKLFLREMAIPAYIAEPRA